MTTSHSRSTTAALVAALALAACSSASRSAPRTAPQPATATESDSPAIAKARADSARHPYTKADVEFMSHMIGHHAQALVMAGWAPTHGASPSVRRLAERIINGQEDEIATMQRWLRDRRQPVPEPALSLSNGADSSAMKMKTHPSAGSGQFGAGHEHLMPGMLTQAQLKELDQARGSEFDRLFLTSMIQHHRGAVTMIQELFGSQGAAQDEAVFKFASDVNVDQSTEIARMERMLTDLPPGDPSP
jgi:uncharacterized protein (DUF305 family)